MKFPKVVRSALVFALLAGRGGVAAAQEPAASPRSSLEDCVARALAGNVDVLSAGGEVAIAEAQRGQTRGQFGPKVQVDASVQRWNEPYVFGGFPVHEATVWNVTATATQPITGLLSIYDAYKVRDLGVDIAAVRREMTRREIALKVVESYYRLLEGERLVEVAESSVERLNAQLKQANSFHENGVVSRDDVLRAELAVANAKQRRIQARASVETERARLAVLMGLPPGTPIAAVPIPDDVAPSPNNVSLDDAERTAQRQRVELREIDQRIEQASRETRAAYWKLVPQVSVVGAYIHNEGSLFSQTNSAYVGGVASWDVFDWGTTTSGISEAKARGRQAALAREKIDDQIQLEVRQAFVNVGSASEAMDVARASVASAEENFRLVKKRYDANAATSFDVIDAEGLLTQTRGQMQTALYDWVIARAELHRAMGASPELLSHERP